MADDEHSGLKEVLAKLKRIGEDDYNGKHYDNALNIFNDLTDRDKKVFLRGVLNIYTMMEATAAIDLAESSFAPLPFGEETEPVVRQPTLPKLKPKPRPPKLDEKEEVPDSKLVAEDNSEFDKANQLELIKLKSWVVKMVVWGMVVGFIMMMVLSVVLTHNSDASILKPLSGLSKILSVIIDP